MANQLELELSFKFGDAEVIIPHVESITRVMVPGGVAMKVSAGHPEDGSYRLSLVSDIRLAVIDPNQVAAIEP